MHKICIVYVSVPVRHDAVCAYCMCAPVRCDAVCVLYMRVPFRCGVMCRLRIVYVCAPVGRDAVCAYCMCAPVGRDAVCAYCMRSYLFGVTLYSRRHELPRLRLRMEAAERLELDEGMLSCDRLSVYSMESESIPAAITMQ